VKKPCSCAAAVGSVLIREMRPSIGSPGMRRGMAQSIETATKNVSR
jgi:hypothetical protein